MNSSVQVLLRRFWAMGIEEEWDEFAEEIVRLVVAMRRARS